MAVAGGPKEGFQSADGHEIQLRNEKALEQMNLRMLSATEKPYSKGKGFIIPREIPMELLRIRVIFTRLREQTQHLDVDQEGGVPVEAFQRAFERLFFLLSDTQGFNAKEYDENTDGFVTWGEFFHVYKRRNIKIKLSIFERIYLTVEDPDSSHLAQIVSIVVLLTIIVSSFCFILGTVRQCQHQDPPRSEPKPVPEFETIETICLVLFILEYVARLFTVWAVRSEIFDEDKILTLVIGYEPLSHTPPWLRLLKFIFAPSNLIDLAAILPALLSAFMDQDGGGFVVLRLIRLTRIFRAFKAPALAEPVHVISQTISQSTKALYVLVFNLLLGIVIFGSLMYLVEGQGQWSMEKQKYERKVGQRWNDTIADWEDVVDVSPFQSIPETFWWAIVTATTVGYGDDYPVTPLGKIVAVLTMVFSLVILALPVGVIGGTFSQVWDDYKLERKQAAETRRNEMIFITKAIQRLDPTRMSSLMLIEVWNDQLGDEGYCERPAPAKFMGEVTLQLDLPMTQEVTKREKLHLEQNNDMVKRAITGSITVEYKWVPRNRQNGTALQLGDDLVITGRQSITETFELEGTLTVTIVSAENLVNLDFTKRDSASSPYCMVLCYPTSPDKGDSLYPCVWRTPTVKNNLNPVWDKAKAFSFNWKPKQVTEQVASTRRTWESTDDFTKPLAAALQPGDGAPQGSGSPNSALAAVASAAPKLDEVLNILRDLTTDLGHVREEVRALSGRVERLSAYVNAPAPPGDSADQRARGEHAVLLPNWVPPPE